MVSYATESRIQLRPRTTARVALREDVGLLPVLTPDPPARGRRQPETAAELSPDVAVRQEVEPAAVKASGLKTPAAEAAPSRTALEPSSTKGGHVVRSTGGSSPTVDLVLAHDIDDELAAAWAKLYAEQPVPSNPFMSLAWVMDWYDKFVPDLADRVVLVVRHPGGRAGGSASSGAVIAVAPMYVHRPRVGPVRLARRLLPVGSGLGQNAYEIPGFLSQVDQHSQAARALVSACLELPLHWSELALTPQQGWLDGQWACGGDQPMAFGEFVRPRTCVVLSLEPTWEATRSTLKRNVKESIRRSANRLAKDGRPFEVVRRGLDLDRDTVERFLALHQARSTVSRKTDRHHPDAYADPRNRSMMLDALPALAREGQASMFELYLDGEHVASQLALHSPGTSYVHSSGFREDTWSLGVITHLQAELIRHAIERGDTTINFSPGPNVSKTRWSDELWVTHEFAFGAGPRTLTARFATFQMLSSLKSTLEAAARRRSQLESSQQ